MKKEIETSSIDEIEVGTVNTFTKSITLDDINMILHIFGDERNMSLRGERKNQARLDPLHLDMVVFHTFLKSVEFEVLGPEIEIIDYSIKWEERKISSYENDTLGIVTTVQEKSTEKDTVVLSFVFYLNNILIARGGSVIALPKQKITKTIRGFPPLRAIEDKLGKGYDIMLERLHSIDAPAMKSAIIYPLDSISIELALESAKDNIIEPVLIGPKIKILALAQQNGFDISNFKIIDIDGEFEAAMKGVELAGKGEIDCIVKGKLHTDDLLHAALSTTPSIKTSRRFSHVFIIGTPNYPKPLLVTDAVVNIAPDLMTKVDIVQNAIDLFVSLFNRPPKVALLSAVETVNQKMQSTLDATAISKMAERGQILHGIVDGPLAFDNAVSAEAARIKGIKSPVAGDADILVVPNIESGNILFKQLNFLSDAKSIGIVLGAKVPIVITSRAEGDVVSRKGSCAIANLYRLRNQMI